ncbi:MAG: AI-2E family transporter [Silvibacterium sp.]|nr:AI-2E family transporter [Silvibacterium sp.]MBV8552361.1 AI-2E family transporter [Acidobacteriaceae bacterium]
MIAFAALIAVLYYGRDLIVTLIISALVALILNPAVVLVMKLRIPRAAATAIVIGIASILVYLLAAMAWSELSTIGEDLPTYSSRLSEIWTRANNDLDQFEQNTISSLLPKNLLQQEQQIQQKPQEAAKARRKRNAVPTPPPPPVIQEVRIHTDPKPVLTTLYRYVSGYFHVLVMASFVPFLVYFMLSWGEHMSETFSRLFPGQDRYMVGKSWAGVGESTRAYVLGNFLLWVLLSSLSTMTFFLLGVPYWPLVGPLSAFFSLVPYVGLPLSVLPPVLAALAVPNKFKIVITVALITAALHIVSMNFLYAKIIGRRVRLNPLVVTIAIMFWGLLWGGVGLVLAIPITAAIKAVCDNVESLEPYGRLLGDD